MCISHHHGETAGPICPKFCTQIHLGPEIYFLQLFKFFFLLGRTLDETDLIGEGRGWGGGGDIGWEEKGGKKRGGEVMGWDGRVGEVR